jgi:hypothetical protein
LDKDDFIVLFALVSLVVVLVNSALNSGIKMNGTDLCHKIIMLIIILTCSFAIVISIAEAVLFILHR